MSSVEIDEIIMAVICMLPFISVGSAAIYLLLAGDPCEEVGE